MQRFDEKQQQASHPNWVRNFNWNDDYFQNMRLSPPATILAFSPKIKNPFVVGIHLHLFKNDFFIEIDINTKIAIRSGIELSFGIKIDGTDLSNMTKIMSSGKYTKYIEGLCLVIDILDSILPFDQTIKNIIKQQIPDARFFSDDIKKMKELKNYKALIDRVVEADKKGSPNVLWDLFVYFKEIQKFDLALEILKKFSDDNLHYQDAMLELANLQAVAPMDLSLDNAGNESQKVAVLDSLLKSKSQEDCARYLHDLMGGTGPAPQWLKETPFDNVPLLLVRMAEQYKTKVVSVAPEQKASPRANPSRLFNGNTNTAATPMSLDNTPRLK